MKSSTEPCQNDSELDDEIADLERRLAQAKARRSRLTPKSHNSPDPSLSKPPQSALLTPAAHFLLLLSDSALPLGSFAFSSGLESYLAHHKALAHPAPHHRASFTSFLPLSVSSYASTTLPFVLAAHRDPSLARLAALDDALDAAIVCTVGRRASVAQGRALLGIWERSFAGPGGVAAAAAAAGVGAGVRKEGGAEAMKGFSTLLKTSSPSFSASSAGGGGGTGDDEPPPVSAHLAPLFGAICALVGLDLAQTAYVFMLGHVKALVSAAVRAGVFGPYQAQKTLASGTVQGLIAAMIEREWETKVEEAGQSVPVMDLWVGRHEVLYSRIFNS